VKEDIIIINHMTAFKLDPNSEYPIYYQIYRYLKNGILSGEFLVGKCLPSENEMITLFGASRITIRRAVNDLENDGYVKKHKGKGTIVMPPKSIQDLSSGLSFTDIARKRGEKVSYVILSIEEKPADGKICEELKIPIESNVFEISRLLLMSGKITGYTIAYMPYKKEWEKIFDDFDETTSLFMRLEENGILIDYITESIEVIKPTTEVKTELRIKDNDPVVYTEHRTYGAGDRELVYTKSYIIYSKYKYSVTIKRREDRNEIL